MWEKIAILITTIGRDDLLMKSLNSILDVYQDNWVILIGDQNKKENYSLEKSFFYQSACAKAHYADNDRMKVISLPYNCGLSMARNELVKKAHEMGIKYCLLSADSIEFTKSMEKIDNLLHYMQRYDLIGLDIKDRVKWEAKLNLVEKSHFMLDFINTTCKKCSPKKLIIYNCNITRNFFLAKTDKLMDVLWDEELKMKEHIDFFWRFKQKGHKVGYTNKFKGQYIGEASKRGENNYSKLRRSNIHKGVQLFRHKYGLEKSIEYKNLENIHK